MVDAESVKHILSLYQEAHDLLDEVCRTAPIANRPAVIRAMAEVDAARTLAVVALQP